MGRIKCSEYSLLFTIRFEPFAYQPSFEFLEIVLEIGPWIYRWFSRSLDISRNIERTGKPSVDPRTYLQDNFKEFKTRLISKGFESDCEQKAVLGAFNSTHPPVQFGFNSRIELVLMIKSPDGSTVKRETHACGYINHP